MWTAADVRLAVVDTETDHPVVTVRLDTPGGRLWVMAEPEWAGRRLTLRGAHVHGDGGLGPNALGPGKLRSVVLLAMEILDVGELVVEGAVRTTGAAPGARPRPVRFARALPPSGR